MKFNVNSDDSDDGDDGDNGSEKFSESDCDADEEVDSDKEEGNLYLSVKDTLHMDAKENPLPPIPATPQKVDEYCAS